MIPRAMLAPIAFVAACGAPTGPSPREEFDRARARWEAQGLVSYQFELTRSCYCVLGGQTMKVEVAGGVVVGAEHLDSGIGIDTELFSYIPTIPDLFDLIEDAVGRPMARFFASYDPSLGYPTRIELDYAAEAVDDESTIVIRNVIPAREASP